MAVIDYSKRSVQLNNLGDVRSVRPIVPDMSGQMEAARSKAAYHGAGARLGGMIADTGARIGRAAIDLSALLASREDDRILAKAAGMVMSIHDQAMLNPERGDDGKPLGLLNRVGEDCKAIPEEGHQKLTESLKAVSEELDLNDRQVEMLQQKLSPYAFSCRGRLMQRRNTELMRIQEAEAKALWARDLQTIADGNNTDDMYRSAIQDFDHYLDVVGSQGEERKNQHDTFVRSLFKAQVEQMVKGFTTEAEFNEALETGEKDSTPLFLGNIVLNDEMGGTLEPGLKREVLEKIREEKERFVSRRDRERRQLAGEARTNAVNAELQSMAANLSERGWVDFYRNLGSDANLREYAPETALNYMEHAKRLEETLKAREEQAKAKAEQASAQKLREAAQIRKAKMDATEENLSLRLTNLAMHEMSGDRELMGGQLAAEQAAIWRDYKLALHGGMLGEGFANTFLNRLKNRLTDQERTAMREFYAAFGYHGELEGDGDVPETAKKANSVASFVQPTEVESPYSGTSVSGHQLFTLGETFLGQLRTMGPDAYRPEIMKTVLDEIKTRKMSQDFNRNRDELAKKMMTLMINAGTDVNLQEKKETKDGE